MPEQTAEDSLTEASLGDVDEVVLQSDLSDVDDWLLLTGWFAMKPHQATLPTLRFPELCDKSVRWDRGYYMVKPKQFFDWMYAHRVFRAPDIPDNHRDDELMRMFPDVGCQWEFVGIENSSLWNAIAVQRKNLSDLEEVATARTKQGKLVGEICQLWLWGGDQSRTHTTWIDSLDGGNLVTMCDSRLGESIAGLTALELANLLVGMHPGDTLTRLLTTLRYLERKAEDMFAHMLEMHAQNTSWRSTS